MPVLKRHTKNNREALGEAVMKDKFSPTIFVEIRK